MQSRCSHEKQVRMKKPDVGTSFHPGHEVLTAFIEGSTGEIDEARVQAHLACCESCVAAYDYAVEHRGTRDRIEPELAPSRLALLTAEAVAKRDYQRARFDPHGWRGRMMRIGPIGRAAIAVVVIAIVAAAGLLPVGRGFDPRSHTLSPITDAMIAASQRGPLVLPGIEDALGSDPLRVRSGPVSVTVALQESLTKLAEAYYRGKLSPDEARWLISGYLVCGKSDKARSTLEGARRRYPYDVDLAALEGVLAYREYGPDVSAEWFEWVLQGDPDNRVALYNLAAVTGELGDTERARELLQRLIEIAPDSPLGRRAAEAIGR
jgi:tetratricopeptide (TPR) repeat protein